LRRVQRSGNQQEWAGNHLALGSKPGMLWMQRWANRFLLQNPEQLTARELFRFRMMELYGRFLGEEYYIAFAGYSGIATE